jgi:catechol 2,3-dioxygenase-like lactoylglutathione lyase family enzyme
MVVSFLTETVRFELFSRDVEASIAFFTRVLGFAAGGVDPSYAELRLGNVVIGLASVDGLPAGHPLRPRDGDERLGLGVEIVVETDDVDAAYRLAVDSGYGVSAELRERPWELRDFRVVSPDGYYVRVTSR